MKYYSLQNSGTNNCLAEVVFSYGAQVAATKCGEASNAMGTYSFTWKYVPKSDGTFRLVSKRSGLCLHPQGNSFMTTAACDGSAKQTWKVHASSSQGRMIKNVAEGTCLTPNAYQAMLMACGTNPQYWKYAGPV